MTATRVDTASSPRRRAPILFKLLLSLLLGVLAVEAVSWLWLRFDQGEWVGHRRMSEIRAEQLDEPGGAEVEIEVAPTRRGWGEHRIADAPLLHPYIGYVMNPYRDDLLQRPWVSKAAAELGFPINVHPPLLEPAENRIVVGIFGGSFANGIAFLHNRLVEELHSIPSFADKEVLILKFSLGGYKQPQQLMALNYLLALGAHFDVVINIDGFNEVALPVATNVPLGYSPFFPRGWPLQVAGLDHELRERVGHLAYLRARRAELAARFSRVPLRCSLSAAALWRVLDRRLESSATDLELDLRSSPTTLGGELQARGPAFSYESDTALLADLVALWKRASLQMHHLCEGLGVPYFHFLQPNQYLPGAKPLSRVERTRFYAADHPYRPAVEQGYPMLIEAGAELRSEGVSFFDFTRIFADDHGTLYRDTCCHLSFEGYQLFAREMATAIDRTLEERAASDRPN